jgi:hypothetical protein
MERVPRFHTHGLAVLLCLACYACGAPGGPYETAGLEWRTSGGDEVISDEGGGVGTDEGPGIASSFDSRDDYLDALNKAKSRREQELQRLDPEKPAHVRLLREVNEIDAKLRNVDLAFIEHRNAFVLAERTLNTFVFQFAPDREWESTYAMRSGDIGLASTIVQGVLATLETPQAEQRPVEHVGLEEDSIELNMDPRTPMRDMAADQLRAETMGAEALLNLAKLAVDAAELGEAERQFRACLNYEADLGVRANALNGYAALLELLDRKEEARRIDAITSRTLNIAR